MIANLLTNSIEEVKTFWKEFHKDWDLEKSHAEDNQKSWMEILLLLTYLSKLHALFFDVLGR